MGITAKVKELSVTYRRESSSDEEDAIEFLKRQDAENVFSKFIETLTPENITSFFSEENIKLVDYREARFFLFCLFRYGNETLVSKLWEITHFGVFDFSIQNERAEQVLSQKFTEALIENTKIPTSKKTLAIIWITQVLPIQEKISIINEIGVANFNLIGKLSSKDTPTTDLNEALERISKIALIAKEIPDAGISIIYNAFSAAYNLFNTPFLAEMSHTDTLSKIQKRSLENMPLKTLLMLSGRTKIVEDLAPPVKLESVSAPAYRKKLALIQLTDQVSSEEAVVALIDRCYAEGVFDTHQGSVGVFGDLEKPIRAELADTILKRILKHDGVENNQVILPENKREKILHSAKTLDSVSESADHSLLSILDNLRIFELSKTMSTEVKGFVALYSVSLPFTIPIIAGFFLYKNAHYNNFIKHFDKAKKEDIKLAVAVLPQRFSAIWVGILRDRNLSSEVRKTIFEGFKELIDASQNELLSQAYTKLLEYFNSDIPESEKNTEGVIELLSCMLFCAAEKDTTKTCTIIAKIIDNRKIRIAGTRRDYKQNAQEETKGTNRLYQDMTEIFSEYLTQPSVLPISVTRHEDGDQELAFFDPESIKTGQLNNPWTKLHLDVFTKVSVAVSVHGAKAASADRSGSECYVRLIRGWFLPLVNAKIKESRPEGLSSYYGPGSLPREDMSDSSWNFMSAEKRERRASFRHLVIEATNAEIEPYLEWLTNRHTQGLLDKGEEALFEAVEKSLEKNTTTPGSARSRK